MSEPYEIAKEIQTKLLNQCRGMGMNDDYLFWDNCRSVIVEVLERELAAALARVRELEVVAYHVPLCADHAQAWFTDRHFKEGDCWFCQMKAEQKPDSVV